MSGLRMLAAGTLLLLASADRGAAQAALLDRAADHAGRGEYTEARAAIGAWWEANGEEGAGAERARALYLRGVLASDVADAERAYLRLAVEHPLAPESDDALLRLGLARYGRGEWAGAERFLRRLVQEYPESPVRADGALWLGRALRQAGRGADACRAFGEAAGASTAIRAEVEAERGRGCDAADPGPRSTAAAAEGSPPPKGSPATTASPRPSASAPSTEASPGAARGRAAARDAAAATVRRPAPEPSASAPAAAERRSATPAARRPPAPAAAPRVTIEVAVLASATEAVALRDRLRRDGFEAFLVRVGSGAGNHVRIGEFRGEAAARPVLRSLRAKGHAGRIVPVGGR